MNQDVEMIVVAAPYPLQVSQDRSSDVASDGLFLLYFSH
uniref:Uncharacterized protein n=1 Tax=Arundo donax TaxID=35708 RepID=A0A0A9ANL4_ARUDO